MCFLYTIRDYSQVCYLAKYGHHTCLSLNVWWPLAGTNNQPRVVTRNTSVLALVSSEWRDSNPRPPGPKPGALPSCATFRVVLYWQVCSPGLRSPLLVDRPKEQTRCGKSLERWVRYRPQDYLPGRGYVGDAVLLSIIVVELDQQKLTHKRPMAQLLVLGVLPRT